MAEIKLRMSYEEIESEQQKLCSAHGVELYPCGPDTKVGIALDTLTQTPINGLRHPPEGDTNGWYIWGGEVLSSSPEFFQPLHTEHLCARLPIVLRFLGLPPGYRFLIAGDYIDVWYDGALLDVSKG